MRYHIIEKEPCCASQQNWPAKLDPSIRGPLCPRKRTPLPRPSWHLTLSLGPRTNETEGCAGGRSGKAIRFGNMHPAAPSGALPLDHVAGSRRFERSSNKRSKSRRFRVPALANSILGLIVL